MQVGEIIKYYRERNGLTQAQLGIGICTATHVSKIEHGKTAYSSEIIAMFSDRLQIDIQKEIESFHNIEKQLHYWHNAMIMQRMETVEKIKETIESFPFISASKFAAFFHLLEARYYLLHQDGKKAYQIVQHVKNNHPDLPPYEKNLLWHIMGIHYLFHQPNSENQLKAIEVLKKIDIDIYGNPEYYYDLAVAYHY
ncbi:helix-turn-helix domain-containing protein [Heyndrickxia sp. NPDC080065]|uniref:helix-turn-helix domain-containing protein n=1 Tax=Heyndrickxia sp. NPDC080065 TaxID=3390568 RepID=UPI003D052A8E